MPPPFLAARVQVGPEVDPSSVEHLRLAGFRGQLAADTPGMVGHTALRRQQQLVVKNLRQPIDRPVRPYRSRRQLVSANSKSSQTELVSPRFGALRKVTLQRAKVRLWFHHFSPKSKGLPMHGIEVTALDHVYLTVSDFSRSQAFYDDLFLFMGFKKGDLAVGGDRHAHYFNRVTQISIRPARSDLPHDPYAPGLHHLCLCVADSASVDRVAAHLEERGIKYKRPAHYPEYAPDYYAVFFEDPDGLRLEIVAERQLRRDIREKWPLLEGFLNPLSRLRG